MRLPRRVRGNAHRVLRAAGFEMRRPLAPLARRPDAQLTIGLEHLIALRMTQSTDLFFVQIGAFDGKTGDQLYPYVVRYGWRGILVEPQPRYFEKLTATYAEQPGLDLRNVAVARESGVRPLYIVDPDVPGLPDWAAQIASFDRRHLERARLRSPAGDGVIQAINVECITIRELLSGIERVDLLQVDVEGFDAEVISMFDFATFRPSIVRFENVCLSRQDHELAVARLIAHGYAVAVIGTDTIAWAGQ